MRVAFKYLLLQPSNIIKLSQAITKRGLCEQCEEEKTAERTLIMIKPDGVRRVLIGSIIKRFEQRGFKLVAIKMVHATDDILKEHYHELVAKPFFSELTNYIKSGPVVPMVWEGENIIEASRKIIGATKALESAPGTIRGDYFLHKDRNILHGSSSLEAAKKEIALWFEKDEIENWEFDWCYED
ncbi:putative nucleoside diphosphate kinase [Trypoxylus dichotomus]